MSYRHGEKWKPGPVSPTCDVLRDGPRCGQPTAYAYPAMGGGYMALCDTHAQRHLRYCVTYEQAQRGEVPAAALSGGDPK